MSMLRDRHWLRTGRGKPDCGGGFAMSSRRRSPWNACKLRGQASARTREQRPSAAVVDLRATRLGFRLSGGPRRTCRSSRRAPVVDPSLPCAVGNYPRGAHRPRRFDGLKKKKKKKKNSAHSKPSAHSKLSAHSKPSAHSKLSALAHQSATFRQPQPTASLIIGCSPTWVAT